MRPDAGNRELRKAHAVRQVVGFKVSLVVCITLVFDVLASKIVGVLLPLGAEKVGLDPAVLASPVLTTIVDAVALLIYFTAATYILGL